MGGKGIRISGNQVAGNQENRISGESGQKTENGKARRKISRGKNHGEFAVLNFSESK
jgi:hypothetical protein